MDWTHTIGNVKHVNRPDTANAKFVIGRYSNSISFLIIRNSGSIVNFDNSVVCCRIYIGEFRGCRHG